MVYNSHTMRYSFRGSIFSYQGTVEQTEIKTTSATAGIVVTLFQRIPCSALCFAKCFTIAFSVLFSLYLLL